VSGDRQAPSDAQIPSRAGARVAFAFLMNGVATWTAHPLQDRMATVLARYTP